MAYQAFYRKYRPLSFSDVVGQEHITETLKNELSAGKTVHAYLFTGTRGTGKTSCAKILAKAINCLNVEDGNPCLKCDACSLTESGENTDIVEIDAASNNDVNNIRDLREQLSFTPAHSKYRVYIIDEVHMLSISAFNALLKTLEEPPAHVVFILATTEVHKLPATILSRCQRFDFKRIEPEKICERIKYIAKKENISITDDAATLIASAADGGMRDALSIFDLCASGNQNIDEGTVSSVCSMAGNEYLNRLADYIKANDCENALLLVDELHNSSVDMLRLLNELTNHYRNLMIMKTISRAKKPIVCTTSQLECLEKQAKDYNIKDIMRTLSVLQSASIPMQTGNRRAEIEMAIIKLCNPKIATDNESLDRRLRDLEANGILAPTEKEKPIKKEEIIKEEPPMPLNPTSQPSTKENTKSEVPANDGIFEVDKWNEIISILQQKAPLMAGVLNGSKAYIKGDCLLIDAPNSQFRSMINSQSNYKNDIRNAAQSVLGGLYRLGPYNAEAYEDNDDPLAKLAGKLKNFELN